jgi:hypothetical protein
MTAVHTGTVTSKDGTTITYDRRGSGPPVVLVDGAFCRRAFGPMPKLAPLLAEHFTVFNYDRRGRDASGDTPPYSIDRELDDLDAVIAAAVRPVRLFGISSGAVLALRAVARGARVERLAIYEPPLVLAGATGKVPPDRVAEITGLVRAGDRGGAVKAFMRMVGAPAIAIPIMRLVPGVWKQLTAVAHTLPNDFAILGDTGAGKPLPAELAAVFAAITVPTVVGVGGKSPPYLHHAAETVQRGVAGATLRVLPKQTHNVGAKPMAAVLNEVFG